MRAAGLWERAQGTVRAFQHFLVLICWRKEVVVSKSLGAVGDAGKLVDWWFIYKVPKDARPSSKSNAQVPRATGYEYAYCDNHAHALAASAHKLNDPVNALHSTLQTLSGGDRKSFGCLFYNDEYPLELHKSNNGDRGHCKGVLAFDTVSDSGIWLLHSTPRFPYLPKPDFPSDELDYGQTFICITLKDVKTAESIATQMISQQGPQAYGAELPSSLGTSSVWHELAAGRFTLSKDPSDVTFLSKGGSHFRSIAKSRLWGQDLWFDLVGDALKADLDVESWRRGAIPGREDSDKHHDIIDAAAIDFQALGIPFEWPETKDHAKMATSMKGEGDWVCVADINRQVSQAKRGGGAICFQHPRLWAGLAAADRVVPGKVKTVEARR
jgi:deoxyribonuclease-2